MFNIADPSVLDVFLQPAISLLPTCENTRPCPDLSDDLFLKLALLRCAQNIESGRDFLQSLAEIHDIHIQRSQYFDSLKSERRGLLLRELNDRLCREHQHLLLSYDPFAKMPELEGREIFAGDGHYIEHACHDPRQADYQNNPYVAIGQFFAINLRTNMLSYLDLAGDGKRKEHDMSILKKRVSKQLKVNGKKGAIWIWDMAGIDFRFWWDQKRAHGVYFISRVKENMAPQIVGEKTWDQSDPRNEGVIKDQLVSVSAGITMRIVTYIDPETRKQWEFVTSDFTLPPGIIVHLYRLRWTLEKVFDETENKFHEDKAWATSATAKRLQGVIVTLCHNLMLLLEAKVDGEEGISDQKVAEKYEKQLRERETKAKEQGCRLPYMIRRLRRRATQLSLQFIRWLRNHLQRPTSYKASLPRLRAMMEAYL